MSFVPISAGAEIQQIFDRYAAVRYTNLAFLALLMYDHALTFDLEVLRIWSLPWRLPKYLFLINRYIVPPMLFFDGIYVDFYNLSETTCDFVAKWTLCPTILALGTAELILIVKLTAIYSNVQFIKAYLFGLYACAMLSWVVIAAIVTSRTTGSAGGEYFSGCLFDAHGLVWPGWVPPVVFESILVALLLYKLVCKDNRNPTLYLVARDSAVYFCVMFAFVLANIFIFVYGSDFLGALLIVPSSAVACIGAARMMLSMRTLSVPDPLGEDGRTVVSTMAFETPEA